MKKEMKGKTGVLIGVIGGEGLLEIKRKTQLEASGRVQSKQERPEGKAESQETRGPGDQEDKGNWGEKGERTNTVKMSGLYREEHLGKKAAEFMVGRRVSQQERPCNR